jgi:hypothetical protein
MVQLFIFDLTLYFLSFKKLKIKDFLIKSVENILILNKFNYNKYLN